LDEEDLWVRSGMNIADHRTCRTAELKREKIRSLRLAMLASPRNEAERAKKYWLSKAMANE
jgi:hypothetical protein